LLYRKKVTHELPSKDEGRGVPEDEMPVGVFEDILVSWKGN
jgi:hypothetical protein